jgi:hypothetical protein
MLRCELERGSVNVLLKSTEGDRETVMKSIL